MIGIDPACNTFAVKEAKVETSVVWQKISMATEIIKKMLTEAEKIFTDGKLRAQTRIEKKHQSEVTHAKEQNSKK